MSGDSLTHLGDDLRGAYQAWLAVLATGWQDASFCMSSDMELLQQANDDVLTLLGSIQEMAALDAWLHAGYFPISTPGFLFFPRTDAAPIPPTPPEGFVVPSEGERRAVPPHAATPPRPSVPQGGEPTLPDPGRVPAGTSPSPGTSLGDLARLLQAVPSLDTVPPDSDELSAETGMTHGRGREQEHAEPAASLPPTPPEGFVVPSEGERAAPPHAATPPRPSVPQGGEPALPDPPGGPVETRPFLGTSLGDLARLLQAAPSLDTVSADSDELSAEITDNLFWRADSALDNERDNPPGSLFADIHPDLAGQETLPLEELRRIGRMLAADIAHVYAVSADITDDNNGDRSKPTSSLEPGLDSSFPGAAPAATAAVDHTPDVHLAHPFAATLANWQHILAALPVRTERIGFDVAPPPDREEGISPSNTTGKSPIGDSGSEAPARTIVAPQTVVGGEPTQSQLSNVVAHQGVASTPFDLQDILDALTREIECEYHRFYG